MENTNNQELEGFTPDGSTIPYPNDGGEYFWDEETCNWLYVPDKERNK